MSWRSRIIQFLPSEPWEALFWCGLAAVCYGVAGYDPRAAWIVGGAVILGVGIWLMIGAARANAGAGNRNKSDED